MLIFLYGPDDYRRSQKKRDLVAEFRKKRSELGLAFFDFEAKDAIEGFTEFTRSASLFEPSRFAVLENAFEVEAKALAKLLQPFVHEKDINILISVREKPVKALAFLLEKPVVSQKFEALEGAELGAFIKAEAKRFDLKLTEAAVQFLATVYAGNSWALATELQKLGSWHPGTGGVIDKKDLDSFDLEAAPNYWALINGAKSFDLKTRLYTLEKLFATNDPAAKIFNILSSQWKEKIPRFAEFDFAVKSGKMDYEEALLDLAIS